MKAALSTLTAATTRARRSAPAQACTAANTGTMNRPPAMASPARSTAEADAAQRAEQRRRSPEKLGDRRDAPGREAEIDREHAEQDGAEHRRQQDDAPGREPGREAGADRDRDRENGEAGGHDLFVAAEHVLDQRRHQRERDRADQPEPAGHDARPTSSRGSSRRNLQQAAGGERRCSCCTTRSGAACPVRGMNRLAPQHISENTIISSANKAGSPPSFAASPPTMVPSRMAMKVAPSTSALPAGSSERCEMVGQDAVFDRAEQRRDHAEQEQREEQHRDGVHGESRRPR